MPLEPKQHLTDAIARNNAAVISLPSAGMLRNARTRFLASAPEGIWIESVPTETPLIDALVRSGELTGVAFRVSTTVKLAFTTKILERKTDYVINGNTTVEALLLATPAEVKSVQRRSNYRVKIAKDSGVEIRVWRLAERAILKDKPPRGSELQSTLLDLSAGGAGILFTSNAPGEKPKVTQSERLRIQIVYNAVDIILEARLLDPRPIAGKIEQMHAGTKFSNPNDDLHMRQAINDLNRILGELQREEVRRQRLGLKAS